MNIFNGYTTLDSRSINSINELYYNLYVIEMNEYNLQSQIGTVYIS